MSKRIKEFMNMKKAIVMLLLLCVGLIGVVSILISQHKETTSSLDDSAFSQFGFALLEKQYVEQEKSYAYYLKHISTGAKVLFLDNHKNESTFSIGFGTPPVNNNGATHVLEHAILSGSEKYPSKNTFYYLQNNSVATVLNAHTENTYTYYIFSSKNQADYYNLFDFYLDSVFNPAILENDLIFKREGIRLEYNDGEVRYNGVVYQEMKTKSLDNEESAIDTMIGKMVELLFASETPIYDAGGTVEDIKNLTYQEVIEAYQNYYTPANAFIFISGQQDLAHSFTLLQSYLGKDDNSHDSVSANGYQLQPQNQAIYQYEMEGATQADIGILYSGTGLSDVCENYARDILLEIAAEQLRDKYDVYQLSDESGGYSSSGLLVMGISTEQVDAVIADITLYINALMDQITADIFDEYLDVYEEIYASSVTRTAKASLIGYLFADDPFSTLETEQYFNTLRQDKGIFQRVWAERMRDNPYSVFVVMGNATDIKAKTEADTIAVSHQELDQIKQATEKYNQWADAPDTEEEIASFPKLTREDFLEHQLDMEIEHTTDGGINYFYRNGDTDTDILQLYFDCMVPQEDLLYAALFTRYISWYITQTGIEGGNTHVSLSPCENYQDRSQISPRFHFWISGSDIVEAFSESSALLKNANIFTAQALTNFLTREKEDVAAYLSNPYFITYEAMLSDLSAAGRFNNSLLGTLGYGSASYLKFLQEIKDLDVTIQKLIAVQDILICSNDLVASFIGNENNYRPLQKLISNTFDHRSHLTKQQYELPDGYSSAMVITDQSEDTLYFMQGGVLLDRYHYSGQMEVLSRIIESGYLLPVLRGKMGAYNASCYFSDGNIRFSVSGGTDVDQIVTTLASLGQYLRDLELSEEALESYIVTTVNAFDSLYNLEWYDAGAAYIQGYDLDYLIQFRNEILSTSQADIKEFSTIIDDVLAQNRVCVYGNQYIADKSTFPFSCEINALTLTVKEFSSIQTVGK